MTALHDDVKRQTEELQNARRANGSTDAAEADLLRKLAAVMVHEEASFDPAHGSARILGATEAHGEVRLHVDGAWKTGSAPEADLLATWGSEAAPGLDDVLEGIQKNFSSARVGNLVAEVREALQSAPRG